MLFLGPISFRKRDHRVSKLIRTGSATDDQLYEAQYGEWPVRGLDKDTQRESAVEFKGYFNGRRTVLGLPFTMAYINPDVFARDIHINRLTLNPASPALGALTSRMVFARLHDLAEPVLGVEFGAMAGEAGVAFFAASILSSYRYAIASSITKLVAPSVSDIVGEEHLHIQQFKDGQNITARRAFLNHAQDVMSNWPKGRQNWNAIKQIGDMIFTLMPRQHYAQDHEMQARIHNLMVRGYKSWGRIPANEDELFAALYDMGIKHPRIVPEYLKEDSISDVRRDFLKASSERTDADGQITRVFLKASQSGLMASPAAELNIGLNYFRDKEIVYDFWRDYLPMLYADLLTKYGNSKGFEAMGYDPNDLNIAGLPIRKVASPLEDHPPHLKPF